MRYHLTKKSNNIKTGDIPVSTSCKATCAPACPFKGNGCYAEQAPLVFHWNAVTNGKRGGNFNQFIDQIKSIPRGQAFRHNQCGDLPHDDGAIDYKKVYQLNSACQGLKAWTYTHHKRTAENVNTVRTATMNSALVVNWSCEDKQKAIAIAQTGDYAVLTVPSDSDTATKTIDGVRFVTCPAQTNDNVTCKNCMLCQKRPSNVVIQFLAHGNGKKKINERIGG